MAIRVKVQKDYYTTEISVDLPASVSDWDEVLRATRTNGKMVVLYNQGSIQGINIEQKTKISPANSEIIRPLLEIESKVMSKASAD